MPRVISWRRDLHQNPELSNREFRTSKLVADHLRRLGLPVEAGVAKTGVIALLKGGRPGPTIVLRADMDGLPVTEQVDLPFRSRVMGKEFADNSLIVGAPARAIRTLDDKARAGIARGAYIYVRRWQDYAKTLKRIG